MKASIIYILIFFCINTFAQDQGNLDSLLQAYRSQKEDTTKVGTIETIVASQLYVEPELAKKYAKEMVALSRKIKYPKGLAMGYYYLGAYFLYKDVPDSAEIAIRKMKLLNIKKTEYLSFLLKKNKLLAYVYLQKDKYDSVFHYTNESIYLYTNRDSSSMKQNRKLKEGVSTIYELLASSYTQLDMYNLALKNELQALKLYKELGWGESMQAPIKNTLGIIESKLGNYREALIYLGEAENIFRLNHEDIDVLTAMRNQGMVYKYLKEYDKAIDYFKNCLSLAQKLDDKFSEAIMWSNMGVSYNALGKEKEAWDSFSKAGKIFKDLNVTRSTYCMGMGDYYYTKNELDSTLYYANKAIMASESTQDLESSSQGYDFRHKVYKKMGNHKRALEDYETYTKLKDSMFNKTKSRQIEELRTIYDTEKKEQQIQVQKQEIEVLTIKEKVSRLQRLLLAFGLSIALVGVYAVYQRNKRHRVAKEKAEMDLEYRTKELTTHALHLAKKNEVLSDIKEKAEAFKASGGAEPGYQTLIQTINFDIQDDNNWENFSKYFEEVHKDFNAKVQQRFVNITSNDLRLMALIKMNLSSKEIASILNISPDGIKKARQRLRKKMELEPTDSLEAVIIAI